MVKITDDTDMKKNNQYRQFCPVALTSEILCNRWTPLILRAFFCGATTFTEIQNSAPLMSSALLSQRLKELEHANIIEQVTTNLKRGKRYKLTNAGEALFPIIEQMGLWAQKWLRREITLEENMNPDILFWELRQLNISHGQMVEKRRVIEFRVGGVPSEKQCYWLVFESDDIEICTKNPGFEPDLWVTAHIKTLVEIWLGHVPLHIALENSRLELDGAKAEIKAFSGWFMLSHFAKAELSL